MKKSRKLQRNLYTFLRAQLSAQFATLTDFTLTYTCFQWLGIHYLLATTIGTSIGGLINCLINYKWAFMTKDCQFKWVLIKYIIVWGGSLALNVFGVFIVFEILKDNVREWELFDGFYLILSKIFVSFLVAVGWNYTLHRYFVFRDAKVKSWFRNLFDNKEQNEQYEY